MSKQEESEAKAKAKVESAESEAEAKPAKKSTKADDDDSKLAKKSAKADDDDVKPTKKSAKADDEDDEEDDKPAKKSKKEDVKPAKAKRTNDDDDDDEDEDDDDDVKPAKKSKFGLIVGLIIAVIMAKRAKDDDDDDDDDAEPAKKSKFGLIVGSIVAVIVIVLAGVLFFHFSGNSSITSSSKPVAAARAFSAHTVWIHYLGNASSIDKDQTISQILDFDGKGNVTVYNMPSHTTFSALRGMSDDAMIAYAKKQDRKNFDEYKKSNFDRIKDEIKDNHYAKYKKEYDNKTYDTALEKDADAAESGYYSYGFSFSGDYSSSTMSKADRIAKNGDKLRKWYEDRLPMEKFELDLINLIDNKIKSAEYRAPKPTKFTLKAETDGTGNNVSSEKLVYDYEYYYPGINLPYMLGFSSSKIKKAISDGVSSADYFAQLEKKWAEGDSISNNGRSKSDKRPLWERALYRLERDEVKLTPSDSLRQVYDMWFGGYDGLSLKVSEKSAGFMLDSANTKGIEIK